MSKVNPAGKISAGTTEEHSTTIKSEIEDEQEEEESEAEDQEEDVAETEIQNLQTKEKFQVAPELTDEEYRSLKSRIEEEGVKVDLEIDEEGNILDGHHRLQACEELGIEEVPVNRNIGLTEDEKIDLAFHLNSARRNMGEGRKKTLIENKFLSLDSRDLHETDQEIADQLGVSQSWVTDIRKELVGVPKIATDNWATSEQKEEITKEYIRSNPEASNREVAENTPVGKSTVSRYKKELEEEDSTTEDDTESSEEGEQDAEAGGEDDEGSGSSDPIFGGESDSDDSSGTERDIDTEGTSIPGHGSKSGDDESPVEQFEECLKGMTAAMDEMERGLEILKAQRRLCSWAENEGRHLDVNVRAGNDIEKDEELPKLPAKADD